jgi:hypothetical protein
MMANYLKLNNSKTEFLMFSYSAHTSNVPDNPSIIVGHSMVPASSSVLNIGATFDSQLLMQDQLSSVVRACNLHLQNIGKIRLYL